MTSETTLFEKYCKNCIRDITLSEVEDFVFEVDEQESIKLLYSYAKTIPISLPKSGKNYGFSDNAKLEGNSSFAKRDYANALQSYNQGILSCPQETDSGKELLSLLIANRSAVFYELNEYKRVFNDIDYLFEIGKYPPWLLYKIWIRKAKCYQGLQNNRSADECFNKAIQSLKKSKLSCQDIDIKKNEIDSLRNKKCTHNVCNEMVRVLHSENFIGGKKYIALHENIEINDDVTQGRYAVAIGHIDIGTIVAEEQPHASVLSAKYLLKNCQNCSCAVDQPVACPTCANVIFCSTYCERISTRNFHKFECQIQKYLYETGASDNCLLALRVITQRSLQFFNDKKKVLLKYVKNIKEDEVIDKKTYRSDDYDNFFFLCRNVAIRNRAEIVHFSCMAILMVRLLKLTGYFPVGDSKDYFTAEETYIAALLLRHLQILQYNAHELAELQSDNSGKQSENSNVTETQTIGAAVYPTLALFNHSCDPSIIRYNVKNKIVAIAIKPINSGDIVYENYGPIYLHQTATERQEVLKSKYLFDCCCTPCVELWPKFQNMNSNELRIPCGTKGCPYVFVLKGEEDPFIRCAYCLKITSIIPHLKNLMTLPDVLEEAEKLFSCNRFEDAAIIFCRALTTMYKNKKPPHPDMVKIQQRIRYCVVQSGNKAVNYKKLFEVKG